jgi:hypothetical protein
MGGAAPTPVSPVSGALYKAKVADVPRQRRLRRVHAELAQLFAQLLLACNRFAIDDVQNG